MSALDLIDGVMPWCSESAQRDLAKARAAVEEFVQEACRLRRTYDLGETTFTDRKEALSRFDAALARIGGAA